MANNVSKLRDAVMNTTQEVVEEYFWKRFLVPTLPVCARLENSFDQGHESVVSSLTWGNSNYVLSGCYDGTAKLWDDRT
eukprot:1697225-Ditylum_brightwellii.AAC.1